MLRHIILGGLIIMGGVSALAQESGRAMQVVSFAVHHIEAFSLQNWVVQKETMSEASAMKVTVLFKNVPGKSPRENPSLQARNTHMDMAVGRSRELNSAMKSKSLLLTITN